MSTVDYVLQVSYDKTNQAENYAIHKASLDALYILVTCPQARLDLEFDRARVNDWLTGIRVNDPLDDNNDHVLLKEALEPADRLRLVHAILTQPISERGCEFSVGHEFITAMLPLHDVEYNKAWIKKWSTQWLISSENLLDLRNHFGEKIGFYFDFVQQYFVWLSVPAAVGVIAWLLNAQYSVWFGIVMVVWSVLFTEFWARRENMLAVWWGVRNYSKVETRRAEFKGERTILDPLTGDERPYFAPSSRWKRYAVTLPIILLIGLLLTVFLGFVFAVEVFFIEFYNGPFSDYLHYFPLVLYCASVPVLNAWYYNVAKRLTDYENHETESNYSRSFTFKIFIMSFLIGYLSIFITAWLYIPYGDKVEGWITHYFGVDVKHTHVGAERLVAQVFYFVVTAQLINVATEVLVPYFTQKATIQAEHVKEAMAEKMGRRDSFIVHDKKERQLLDSVEQELIRPEYDLYEDYAEMVMQFGYVSLFSIVWPLTPLLCFANNWLELRSDAIKIIMTMRRPVPSRAETIGPWLDNLRLLTWMSALTNAIFIYQFGGYLQASDYKPPVLQTLAVAVAAERFYFFVNWAVKSAYSSSKGWAEVQVEKEAYELREKWLKRTGLDALFTASIPSGKGDTISLLVENVFKSE